MAGKLEQIIDGLRQARSLDDLNRFITRMRDALEVEHLVYHSVGARGDQWAALTYKPEWVSHYIERDFARLDPVVQGCLRSFHPFDWKRLDWHGKQVRSFLGEALDAGVGRQGFSVPVHGPNGQFAVFTVNDRISDQGWERYTDRTTRELLLISHYVNQQALEIMSDGKGVEKTWQNLSPREIDTLTYLALGFSRGQAADSLKISEHTLRVYIESARFKLGAMNTTHAVARALTLGLLVV